MTSKPDPVVRLIVEALMPEDLGVAVDGAALHRKAERILAALEAAGLRIEQRENVTALIKAAKAELASRGSHTLTRVQLNNALIPFRDTPEQSDD